MQLEEAISQIPKEVIDFVLSPYKEKCRYIRESEISENSGAITLKSRLSVPTCYYSSVSGAGQSHFNATEFILAFNQMGYVLFAEVIRQNLLSELKLNSIQEFAKAQMDRFLINKYSGIVFRRPIDSKDFEGTFSMKRPKSIRNTLFFPVSVKFTDRNGGYAEGSSTICLIS